LAAWSFLLLRLFGVRASAARAFLLFFLFFFCRVPFGVPVFCLLACLLVVAGSASCLPFSPFFSAGGFGRCVLFACRVGFGPRLFLALVSLCGSPSVPAGWRGGLLCSWCCLSGRFWVRARWSRSVLASLPLPSCPFSPPFRAGAPRSLPSRRFPRILHRFRSVVSVALCCCSEGLSQQPSMIDPFPLLIKSWGTDQPCCSKTLITHPGRSALV
jgi:hypothetical protein